MNVDIAALKHSTSTFLGSPSVFPDELHAAELYGDLETLACKSTCNPSTGNVKKQAVDGQSVYGQATTAAPEQGRIAIRKREQPDPVEELSNRTSPGKKMRPSALLGVTLHPSTAPESEGSCQPFSAIVIHFDIDTDTENSSKPFTLPDLKQKMLRSFHRLANPIAFLATSQEDESNSADGVIKNAEDTTSDDSFIDDSYSCGTGDSSYKEEDEEDDNEEKDHDDSIADYSASSISFNSEGSSDDKEQ